MPRRHVDRPGSLYRRACAIGLILLAVAGCTLTETALAPEVDALVVEASFQWSEARENRMLVWVHRALGPSRSIAVEAEVEVGLPGGGLLSLPRLDDTTLCVDLQPEATAGSCYAATGGVLEAVSPGDRLTLAVRPDGGGLVEGQTTLPELHTVVGIPDEGRCTLSPDTPLPIHWSSASGVWAYINETLIYGLGPALASAGITVEEEPLALLGLSISAQDTTVVFPGEFGIFQRGDLDQDLALVLQAGLPSGTEADVTITGADRNLVNWVRGGSFNPSGQVRVPSLTGDGTGFFGSAVLRRFRVVTGDSPAPDAPACPLG